MKRSKKLPIENTIRTCRFFAGEMTQQALAEKVGVTRQTILAIEAGRYSPSLELAFLIAHAFGKPLEEVFHFIPPEEPEKVEEPEALTQDLPHE
jgi:putative transcriptional regulator